MTVLFRNCANVYPVHMTANFKSHWGTRPWTPDGVYGDDVHESFRGKPRYQGVQHDECPKSWPWWRIVAFYLGRLDIVAPTSGMRLWVYTRWGSIYADVVIDRRGLNLGRARA